VASGVVKIGNKETVCIDINLIIYTILAIHNIITFDSFLHLSKEDLFTLQ